MMKKFYVLFFSLMFSLVLSQNQPSYKDWDDHDVTKIYQKQELPYESINEEGEDIREIYTPLKIKDGIYEVELMKISSNFYQVRGKNIYLLFRYNPYLYNYDEGVFDVSYNSGTFYEKP